MSAPCLTLGAERDGALLRLTLARPKANLIDAAMIAALDQALVAAEGDPALKAVLLDHEGPHFSFGASVAEHLPDQCAAMLAGLHALILRMVAFPLPILVALRGQCLGGGLEVACAGTLLFAAPDARLGQPEIQLGVFAPAASCLLPERIGPAAAAGLLLSGQPIDAAEAARLGLVQQVADDPAAAALAWFDHGAARHSPSSLRFALRAARLDLVERVRAKLAAVEALYLDGLMATRDAAEGLTAFLDKRPAVWEGR
ncbi:cyclohexa-1,5-dienecarbonyl-CoA hydratase [Phaeospirillum tilakii]|uniref:Cyclohexa-1,5-dienecarbonyl-CoA hydratase n=1 Tax=Phaeospirillum tilakii TaxID=741673 RepID=A0ABW5CCG9_9PROT